MPKSSERLIRSRVFYSLTIIIISAVALYLLLALRSLIVPTIIGMLAAYISSPLLTYQRRKGIPKSIAILILLGAFGFIIFVIGKQIVNIVPNEKEKLELRIQVQYKLNEIYLDYMDMTDYDSEGNFLYDLIGNETTPFVKTVNMFLMLDDKEKELFKKYTTGYNNQPPVNERIIEYHNVNKTLPFTLTKDLKKDANSNSITDEIIPEPSDSKLALIINAISTWIVMPFVFIFLLIDDGQIKKYIINLVPNKYFEMALTTFENVDKAVGNYLRGTFTQCSLVGITIFLGLLLVGFDFEAAALIGIVAGIANAIPFLGPVIGLGAGILYALIVDGIDPIIPYILPSNPVIGVLIVVAIAQAMDNAVFQPLVLGKAVNLHPLVVIFGVTGGSILFGFIGMLFAIPAIVIFNVITSTIFKQLKAYYLIY
ncbi:MAG: AI-2E family transporter [Melioribacteraceae bacterium]|nr:AI-2E family transporter [Melioribacteraceae bacterium]MCF8356394.1 AI-2E family transporter [Melioribacteraceae bacterium]MCF8392255.1 AI-2E family transporter [Melioribacteraceae bacterium]MCF8417587.1 AI-2E family transporter [Melioribacteraceae bacterium]